MPPAMPAAPIMVGVFRRVGGDVDRTDVERWTEVVGDIAANGSPSNKDIRPIVVRYERYGQFLGQ